MRILTDYEPACRINILWRIMIPDKNIDFITKIVKKVMNHLYITCEKFITVFSQIWLSSNDTLLCNCLSKSPIETTWQQMSNTVYSVINSMNTWQCQRISAMLQHNLATWDLNKIFIYLMCNWQIANHTYVQDWLFSWKRYSSSSV